MVDLLNNRLLFFLGLGTRVRLRLTCAPRRLGRPFLSTHRLPRCLPLTQQVCVVGFSHGRRLPSLHARIHECQHGGHYECPKNCANKTTTGRTRDASRASARSFRNRHAPFLVRSVRSGSAVRHTGHAQWDARLELRQNGGDAGYRSIGGDGV